MTTLKSCGISQCSEESRQEEAYNSLLWDIWMTLWLGKYIVVYHEFSPRRTLSSLRNIAVSGDDNVKDEELEKIKCSNM